MKNVERIIIWGTGANAESCIASLDNSNCEIVGFVESCPKIQQFRGIDVLSPVKLREMEYDYLIIASQYISEISDELRKYNVFNDKVINWLDYKRNPEQYKESLYQLFSDDFLKGCLIYKKDPKDFSYCKETYNEEYNRLSQKKYIYVYDLRLRDYKLAVSRLINILIEYSMHENIGMLFIPDEKNMDTMWYHHLLFELSEKYFVLWNDMREFYVDCKQKFKQKFIFAQREVFLSKPIYYRTVSASRYMNFSYCFEPSELQKKVDKAEKVHFYYFYSSRIGETIRRVYWLKKAYKKDNDLIVLIPEDYAYTLTLGTNSCFMELVSREFCMIRDESELWFWIKNILKNPDKYVYHKDIDLNTLFQYDGTIGQPSMDFFPEELNAGKELIRRKLNLQKESYVCICVRDFKYMATVLKPLDDTNNAYRNVDFTVLKRAIEYLGKQDIVTVRMGQVMDAIPKLENCIDFPNICYDEYLDLMLHRNCKFILGGDTGGIFLSHIFSKPMALLMYQYPIIDPGLCYKKEDLVIFSRLKDLQNNRMLSILETIQKYYEFQVDYGFNYKYFEERSLLLLPFTEEEVCDLAKEMNGKLDGTWVSEPTDEELMQIFNKIVDEIYMDKEVDLNLYAQPTIATTFLRANRDELLAMREWKWQK